VQSTVPIVVGEQPKGHAGFIPRDDGSRYCDDGHATTHLCAATVEITQAVSPISAGALRRQNSATEM
jgi:hypothetical protein